MPTTPIDFPFQFRVCGTNEDIRLLTTSDSQLLLELISIFDLEDEIAFNTQVLFEANRESKTTVIALHSFPEEGQNYAYAALLECDLCGVRKGFFALFKSASGDTATLTRECKLMYEFINAELEKEQNLSEFKPLR